MYYLIFQVACSDLQQAQPDSEEIFSDAQIQEVLGNVKSIVKMWGEEQYGPAYSQLNQLYKEDLNQIMMEIRKDEPEVNLRLETQIGQMLYLMQNNRYPTDDRLPKSFLKLLENELKERVVVVAVDQVPEDQGQ